MPRRPTLLQRIRNGDEPTWKGLYLEVYPRLLGIAMRRLRRGPGHHEVEELVQESWRRALGARAGFKGNPSDDDQTRRMFHGWIDSIASNVCANADRDARHDVLARARPFSGLGGEDGPAAFEPPADEQSISADLKAREASQHIQRALQRLTALDHEIVRLRFYDDPPLSFRDIAARVRRDESTVRYHFYEIIVPFLQRTLRGLRP
jgi:RNA polymerase sigma factor (sigma-70 family)